jgi:hypothetical protein
MKALFISSTITTMLLLLISMSYAQNPLDKNIPVPPGFRTETHKKINFEKVMSHEWERINTKKATLRINLQNDIYNPYKPYNPPRMITRYNTTEPYYDGKKETFIGDVLRSILLERAHHH